MVSTLIAWHLEMLSMIEDMMSPRFFFLSPVWQIRSVMLPTQVQLGIRVLILKQARQNIKDWLRLVLTQFCRKVMIFLYIWIDTLIYKH